MSRGSVAIFVVLVCLGKGKGKDCDSRRVTEVREPSSRSTKDLVRTQWTEIPVGKAVFMTFHRGRQDVMVFSRPHATLRDYGDECSTVP